MGAIFVGMQIAFQTIQLVGLIALLNGWLNNFIIWVVRKLCFFLDCMFVRIIDSLYQYFVKFVEGSIITPSITNDIMSRLYIIIGIFIFFKLSITIIQYLINPEMFADEKTGVSKLIKRVVLGSIVIILIPTIFNIATGFQTAVIKDDVIARIMLPSDAYKDMMRNKSKIGKEIAYLTLRGFLNLNPAIQEGGAAYSQFSRAEAYSNPDYINNINLDTGSGYAFDYLPVVSTAALIYMAAMMLKYTLEVAVRSFKMMLMQLLAPIVIVNYMTSPANDDTMKKWLNTTISTYLIIFIRVMTLWFIALIAYYLRYGVPQASGEPVSLLTTDDSFLKALIIVALFAFLKELPTVISNIFGYDLKENEVVGGLVGKALNIAKGVGLGAVAFGAGVVGGAVSAGGKIGSIGKEVALKDKNTSLKDAFATAVSKNNPLGAFNAGLQQSTKGLLNYSLGNFGAAMTGGYSNARQGAKQGDTVDQMRAADAKKAKEDQERKETLELQANVKKIADNTGTKNTVDLVGNVIKMLPPNPTRADIEQTVKQHIFSDDATINNVAINATGQLHAKQASGDNITAEDITQTVHQELGKQIDVSVDDVRQLVNQEVNGKDLNNPNDVQQVVQQVTQKARDNKVEQEVVEVERIINQQFVNDTNSNPTNPTP